MLTTRASVAAAPELTVPPAVRQGAIDTLGKYFEPLCGVDRVVLGNDHVDAARYRRNIEALDAELPLAGKKLLEIGSSFGVRLAVIATRLRE